MTYEKNLTNQTNNQPTHHYLMQEITLPSKQDPNNTIWIDTETGGLDPQRHALLSVGLYDPKINLQLEIKILPQEGLRIEDEAIAVNGYSSDLWQTAGAIPEADAIKIVAAKLATYHFLGGQNTPFDAGFIKAAMKRHQINTPITRRLRDLQSTAIDASEVGLLPILPSYSLNSIAASLGLARASNFHGALEDAMLTQRCHQTILKLIKKI
jgi:DNA polymerase-3 subunit epsilon/ribonuclease T